MRIPVRHYQIAQMYGPGMPPSGREGLHGKTLVWLPGHVGLVLVHIWNVGEPDGPYPIEGKRLPGHAGDWYPERTITCRRRSPPYSMRLETQASASFTWRSTRTRIGIPYIAKSLKIPSSIRTSVSSMSAAFRPRTVPAPAAALVVLPFSCTLRPTSVESQSSLTVPISETKGRRHELTLANTEFALKDYLADQERHVLLGAANRRSIYQCKYRVPECVPYCAQRARRTACCSM